MATAGDASGGRLGDPHLHHLVTNAASPCARHSFTVPLPTAVLTGPNVHRVAKRIALIAHDGRKHELLELVAQCLDYLRWERLVATAGTGRLVAEQYGLDVELVGPGALGGDLQIGALVATGDVKLVVFLHDPLGADRHEPRLDPLLKVCDVHRVPLATNLATALLCAHSLAEQRRPALTAV
jgi:methylglyoxal synthase